MKINAFSWVPGPLNWHFQHISCQDIVLKGVLMRPRRSHIVNHNISQSHIVIVSSNVSAFKLLKFMQCYVMFRSKLPLNWD